MGELILSAAIDSLTSPMVPWPQLVFQRRAELTGNSIDKYLIQPLMEEGKYFPF